MVRWSRKQHEHYTGCSKRPSSKAAASDRPEAYPLGTLRICDEARTKLADFFSSLLGFRLDTFNIESDLNLVADDEPTAIQCLVPDHTEIFPVEFPLGAEAGPHIAPGILRRPVITARQGDFLGHPAQGEISHR